jgi:hypothetical protein
MDRLQAFIATADRMMKASIRGRVIGARLPDTVPPLYREAVSKDGSLNPQEFYSVILCAHTERDVVSSSTLIRAFRRMGPPAPGGILVIGTVFTEEALALAAEKGARVIALRKSKWTDESARQRQLPAHAKPALSAPENGTVR